MKMKLKIMDDVKNEKIAGINVTVPFKKTIIPFVDELTLLRKLNLSNNTIKKIIKLSR